MKFNKTLLALALTTAFPCAQSVLAEEADAALKEMVVTATKSAMDVSDAPAAVSVVTARNIETKNVSRLGDALLQTPSLYLQNGALGQSQGTSGSSGMSLRGVDQKRTLIMIDGQPIQDGNSGAVNWRTPFVEDIEQVEVVPGASSSLYGSNAIGGVINVISKRPDKREVTIKLKQGWQDAQGEDISVYYRDKLSNGFGIAAGFGYQDRDSYVNDFVVKTPATGTAGAAVTGARTITTKEGLPAYLVGDRGAAPWRQVNATTKLFYDLSPRDKFYGGISYSKIDLGYTQSSTYLHNALGDPVYTGTVGINGRRVTLAASNFVNSSPLVDANTRYFAGYEGILANDYKLKVDLARIDRQYYFSTVGTGATWQSGPGAQTDSPNTSLDGTAQLSFPVGSRQFLVTGIALHRDTVDRNVYALADWRNIGSRTVVNNGYRGNSTTSSLFAQDEISLTDTLKTYVGGRLDRWETKGDYFQNTAPATNTSFPSRSVTAFSPKVSTVYKPVDAATLRASFGRAFRAPTNLDLYSNSIISSGSSPTGYVTTQSDPGLKPERGTAWEVGGELRPAENLKFNATYYETVLSDLIYSKQQSLSLTQRINAGKAKIRGIEFGVATKLASWLEMNANYAYIGSKMLENDVDPLSVGKRLTDSPKNIANIGFVTRQGPWTWTLDTRYVSHIYQTAQNVDTVEGVPGSYDSHFLMNTKIGYEIAKGTKVNIAINNLMDKEYYTYYLNPKRNVTAELVLAF